jgi:hypothetical protein
MLATVFVTSLIQHTTLPPSWLSTSVDGLREGGSTDCIRISSVCSRFSFFQQIHRVLLFFTITDFSPLREFCLAALTASSETGKAALSRAKHRS